MKKNSELIQVVACYNFCVKILRPRLLFFSDCRKNVVMVIVDYCVDKK